MTHSMLTKYIIEKTTTLSENALLMQSSLHKSLCKELLNVICCKQLYPKVYRQLHKRTVSQNNYTKLSIRLVFISQT